MSIPEFSEADVAWMDEVLPGGSTAIGYVAAISYLDAEGDPAVWTLQLTNEQLSTVIGLWEMGKLDAVRHWNPKIFRSPTEDDE